MESAYVTSWESLEVREADGRRELLGISVPYNRITERTATGRELFRPGAFASACGAADKVRLIDENHTAGRRPAGVAMALEERGGDRPGLYSRWRFYDTPEGRAAWENAKEGTYGGLSVGFYAVREQHVGGVREILEARLHHVSLVDEPAYEDAKILAVRSDDLARYARYATPTQHELDADDTPLSVRVRRVLGAR